MSITFLMPNFFMKNGSGGCTVSDIWLREIRAFALRHTPCVGIFQIARE